MTENRIGIFGGAFDPPHSGHVNLAKEALVRLGLTELLVIPTAVPPHKEAAQTPFSHRAALCDVAFSFDKRIKICDIEQRLGHPNYTYNTLRELKRQYPKRTKFFLLIGADMLFSFESWYRYDSIQKECSVVAAARNEGEYSDMLEFATQLGNIKVLNLPVYEASSTEIRQQLASGQKPSALPPAVYDYIKENGLYE